MATVDKDIESRIVRYLDGELDADAELELNREILRNPEARRLLDEYQRIDELSVEALEQIVPQREPAVHVVEPIPAAAQRSSIWSHRAWWILPGAVAAALVIVVFNVPQQVDQPQPLAGGGAPGQQQRFHVDNGPGPAATVHQIQPVSLLGPRQRVIRDTERNVIAVVGEDGKVYLLEIDRIRTLKRPTKRALAERKVRNEL